MIKVCIIEDDLAIVNMYRMKFQDLGYHVMVAGNGEDGLKLIEKDKPDIVLLDIMMPVMRGDEMLEKLRKKSWGKDLRVVVLTNVGENEVPEVIQNDPAVDYIIKAEMTPKQVAAKIQSILGQ